ncbi:MAG: VanZ family protein [Proteobacteria bacterium]|nr:VanZ family protein [Burkholderiales bacterium]
MLPLALRLLGLGAALALSAAILLGGREPGAAGLIVPPWDKVVHALTYGALAASWCIGLGGRRIGAAILLAVATGALDETLQRWLPGRDSDFADLAADAIGATLAAWITVHMVALMQRVIRR